MTTKARKKAQNKVEKTTGQKPHIGLHINTGTKAGELFTTGKDGKVEANI